MKQENTDGHLSLYDEEAFNAAVKYACRWKVKTISIGAKCFRKTDKEELFSFISKLKELTVINLSDDYTPDKDMKVTEKKVKENFPTIKFNWSYDLLIDGKHGR